MIRTKDSRLEWKLHEDRGIFAFILFADLFPALKIGLEHSRCPINTEKHKAVPKGSFGPIQVGSNQRKEQLARLVSIPT